MITLKMQDGTTADNRELQQELVQILSLIMILAGGALAWAQLPGPRFAASPFVLALSLFVEGLASFHLCQRHPWIARLILFAGPIATFVVALAVLDSLAIPFFASLIVIANAAISPPWGFASALATSLGLWAWIPANHLLMPALFLVWMTAVIMWVSSHRLYTVLSWAWRSQQHVTQLLEKLRDHQGELNRTIFALREATQRLQHTGYELAVARLQADEARALKERFAANISHELRTPLNLVLGFSELMYFTPDVYGKMEWPTRLRHDIQQIYRSSRQLLDLVNDVLDLAQIDAAEMPIHKERSDLRDIIQEAVSTINDLVRGRDLVVTAHLPDTLPQLYLDRARIRQVLINLLSNATRFTEQGTIVVSARTIGQEVVVSVTDTGVGIPAEELASIFDEFHQVDMSLRRRKEGAGLGLAISKRFVELHGGRIWAESQLGRGSTFYFALPLTSEAAFESRLLRTREIRPSTASHRSNILLIDQDPAVGDLLNRYLGGYHVIQCPKAQEAPALVAQCSPRAVIVNLPPNGENHWETITQLCASLPQRLPVIGCCLPSQQWLAAERGVYGCLTKPISREQLLTTLAKIEKVQDVLVVDDDRHFVQLVARYLESAQKPYRVRWAYEGAEALERIRQHPPDAILLDLVMPGMDGFALLETLQENPTWQSIPVLIVTATDLVIDLLAHGGNILTVARARGFSPSEIISQLQALLDAPQTLSARHRSTAASN